jgi:hypothetical protein
MICPKCGYTPGNHVAKKQQSDKEFYLQFWGYTPDTPEAEEAWKQKQEMVAREAPTVMSDIPGHISMADGTWIDSRSKHRENLKRNGCVELGNDVPLQQKAPEMSRKSQEARKRQIAELAYAKLNYR